MFAYIPIIFLSFVWSKPWKINQILETLREPTRQYAQLIMNPSILIIIFSYPDPPPPHKEESSGDVGEVKGRWFWWGGKGSIFEAVKEGVDWCGPRNLWKEEVIGVFSG